MTTWLTGEVAENKQWCDDLFSLKIKTPPVTFSAGQFVKAGIGINGDFVARPYSLVNTPDNPLLEIHFNRVAEGALTPSLSKLSKGDSIKVSDRASGLLTLEEIPDVPDLWLFATGTGIGPFMSILGTAEPWARFKNIILAYSVKTQEKLAYRDNLLVIQQRYPEQFHFVPYITRETIANTLHSRITTSVEKGELEKHVGLKLSTDSSHLMLCGNSTMVTDITTILENRGLRRHTRREPGQIATEKYY